MTNRQPSEAQITREEAESYVKQVRNGNRDTRRSVFMLEQRSAHLAYGYKTFGSFVDKELCQHIPRATINHHRKLAKIECRVTKAEAVGNVRDILLRELNNFSEQNQRKIWLKAKTGNRIKVTTEDLQTSAKSLGIDPKKARRSPKTAQYPVKEFLQRAIKTMNDDQLVRLHAQLTTHLGYRYV